MIRQQLLKLLSLQAGDLQRPTNSDHGDFSTNIAFKKKVDPDEFMKNIPVNDLIEKSEIMKPGFINFFISKKTLLNELQNITQDKDSYGQSKQQGSKIILEFGQPNTHKVPHIGHLFSYVFGESLTRIMEAVGNTVYRTNWQGDIGLHVAKCLYAVKLAGSRVNELTSLEEKIQFLQECYQEGSELYEQDKSAERKIDELNQKIYKGGAEIKKLWEETRKWSLEYYKKFEEHLGIKFDKYYFESVGGPVGKKIIEENVGTIFEKSDGAIVFRGEKYGLHTRVFINKHGNPTYEGKEIGLNKLKLNDYKFDLSLVTTASEQNEFFKVAFKAAELVFSELKGKLKHLGFGMINLAAGKMSSRTGQIVSAFDLVDMVRKEIKKEFKTSSELAGKIALASIKYSFLKSEAKKNMTFDLKTSITKEGDSGPYLLYTYVRTQSMLSKIQDPRFKIQKQDFNDEELILLRKLCQFPEVIEDAAKHYSPHLLSHFLYGLAKDFNFFYQKHPVLKSDDDTRNFRLLLTSAVAQVIKNGLYLLGIETVDHM